MTTALRDTMIIWRRFGKEHGEGQGFRVNPPEVVERHLREKVERSRQTPLADWRWWQVNDDLLIETTPDSPRTIYYLPRRGWIVIYHPTFEYDNAEWSWYVHLGDVRFNADYDCWVFTDLFVDIILREYCRTHLVLDLHDLGEAMTLGLLDTPKAVEVLTNSQRLIDAIHHGEFPPVEVREFLEGDSKPAQPQEIARCCVSSTARANG